MHGDDQELADAFGDEDGSDDDDELDDRQRLMRANPDGWAPADYSQMTPASSSETAGDAQEPSRDASATPRRPTILPTFTVPGSGGSRSITASNDGVFANLAAKPERGEKTEDLPPVSSIRFTVTHYDFGLLLTIVLSIVLRRSGRRCNTAILGDHYCGSRHFIR